MAEPAMCTITPAARDSVTLDVMLHASGRIDGRINVRRPIVILTAAEYERLRGFSDASEVA